MNIIINPRESGIVTIGFSPGEMLLEGVRDAIKRKRIRNGAALYLAEMAILSFNRSTACGCGGNEASVTESK